MDRFKILITIACLCVAGVAFAPATRADEWNKKTVVTFSQPIEIPGGIILPAGTYVFRLLDSISNRHIVQIFNQEENHVFATILAIPNWRLRTTSKTVMTFGESVVGEPQAIRAWFYPGSNSGEEFVYPKRRAIELAKATNVSVFAMPAELEPVITLPVKSASDEPAVTLKSAPLTAITPTGEEVDVARVLSQPSQAAADQQTATGEMSRNTTRRLPQTASELPVIALLGLLSLGAAMVLWAVPKLRAEARTTKS